MSLKGIVAIEISIWDQGTGPFPFFGFRRCPLYKITSTQAPLKTIPQPHNHTHKNTQTKIISNLKIIF